MTNKEIAKHFQYLGEIMELHEDNPFKIKSYLNAYLTLRKVTAPLAAMQQPEIAGIKGIGASISASIKELLETGGTAQQRALDEKTPPGVREMLHIPGFGPKKIRTIWKDLGVESVGELLYACNENRLVELKGFGQKTQEDLRQKLEYFQKSQGKYLFADIEPIAQQLLETVSVALPSAKCALVGAVRRMANVVERVEILVAHDGPVEPLFAGEQLVKTGGDAGGSVYWATADGHVPVSIYHCPLAEFGSKYFRYSAGEAYLQTFLERTTGTDFKGLAAEEAVYERAGMPWLPAELREEAWAVGITPPQLLEVADVRGVVHAHSTWSDGINSLEEMALHARSLGYAYLGITDHSKAAFYANGLKEDRVLAQWAEIDKLNKTLAPFRIFKGIESDILADGSLDYPDDLLAGFDFIIASVHSNLRMDEEKATARVLRAVENPFTTILGHPTGRLLLSRPGYPLDHRKIIDACAANSVAIELNANPYRLDLDWTWIPYALEKGVLISVNPDAHSVGGIRDIRFGVLSARKGGLDKKNCLTCFELEAFSRFITHKR